MEDLTAYPHLTRSGKQGTLRYRRAVLADLRAIIGRREIVLSLGTSDLETALPGYHEVAARTQRQLVNARQRLAAATVDAAPMSVASAGDGEPTPPQATELAALDTDHYAACVEAEKRFRQWLTQQATKDFDALIRGKILPLPAPVQMAVVRALRPQSWPWVNPQPARIDAATLVALICEKRLEERWTTLAQLAAGQNWPAIRSLYKINDVHEATLMTMVRAEQRFIADVLDHFRLRRNRTRLPTPPPGRPCNRGFGRPGGGVGRFQLNLKRSNSSAAPYLSAVAADHRRVRELGLHAGARVCLLTKHGKG